MANNSNPEEILRGLVRGFSVIYKRYCGHETVCDVMDVLYLGIEPNWGCDEGDCDEMNDGINEIEITGSYEEWDEVISIEITPEKKVVRGIRWTVEEHDHGEVKGDD